MLLSCEKQNNTNSITDLSPDLAVSENRILIESWDSPLFHGAKLPFLTVQVMRYQSRI